MAQASRSNKRQPAFDPSEIDDLIFSPAVGSGVGSHLIHEGPTSLPKAFDHLPFPHASPTVDSSPLTTIVSSHLSTVDTCGGIDLVGGPVWEGEPEHADGANSDVSPRSPLSTGEPAGDTTDILVLPTVDMVSESTVGATDAPTVDTGDQRTVSPATMSDVGPVTGPTVVTIAAIPPDIVRGPANNSWPEPKVAPQLSTVDRLATPTVDTADLPTVIGSAFQGSPDTDRNTEPSPLRSKGSGKTSQPVSGPNASSDTTALPVTNQFASGSAPLNDAKTNGRRQTDVPLWITEQGELISETRVRRIRLAQDVVNSAEESVYDTLWSAKSLQSDDRDYFRIVQVGYDYLVKRTRLAKKTIQRIVARLLDKDFIAIERHADIYQRTSTIYRVFSYKAVLERHVQRGRSHVVKMGPGFSYVHPLADPRPGLVQSSSGSPNGQTSNMSTVDLLHLPTVESGSQNTVASQTIETEVKTDLSTVVPAPTIFIGSNEVQNKTTATATAALYEALIPYGGVDDESLTRLVKTCKQNAPDCTTEEIIYFIHEKATLVRGKESRIYNPMGFLLTAVPRCFSGEAFQLYRESQKKQREIEAAIEAKRQAELDEWRKEQQTQLNDPRVSEEDKQFIRKWLGNDQRT